jgi:hypothetical protein
LPATAADDIDQRVLAEYPDDERDPAHGSVSAAVTMEQGMEISCRCGLESGTA